jgi:hypothetical protein
LDDDDDLDLLRTQLQAHLDDDEPEIKALRKQVEDQKKAAELKLQEAQVEAALAEGMERKFAVAQQLIQDRATRKRKVMDELEAQLAAFKSAQIEAVKKLQVAKASQVKIAAATQKLSSVDLSRFIHSAAPSAVSASASL